MYRFLIFVSLSGPLFAESNFHIENRHFSPLFNGPLLAGSGNVVAPAHFAVSTLFLFNQPTYLNNPYVLQSARSLPENINFQFGTAMGVFPRVEFKFFSQVFLKSSGDSSLYSLGDCSFGFSYGLLRASDGPWPSMKFSISESFPTGVHDGLSEENNLTDATGGGSYVTSFSLNGSRVFTLFEPVALSLRVNTSYKIFTDVVVNGINVYGGSDDANGVISHGGQFEVTCGIECSLTRSIAIAIDIDHVYSLSSSFSGVSLEPVGNPDNSYVLSLAPSMEYSYSPSFGITGGVWFSVVGDYFFNGMLSIGWSS